MKLLSTSLSWKTAVDEIQWVGLDQTGIEQDQLLRCKLSCFYSHSLMTSELGCVFLQLQ